MCWLLGLGAAGTAAAGTAGTASSLGGAAALSAGTAGLGTAATAGLGTAATGGFAEMAKDYLMDYGPMALGIANTLMDSSSEQTAQEAKYDQLKWAIEGRNIAKKGELLANQDRYKQLSNQALDSATRAYFKYDLELNNQIKNANVKTQQNLIELFGESSKGSAKGLGGTTAERLDMQSLKNWGRKNTEVARKITDSALAAEFNKETAQIKASDQIKINRQKLGVDLSTIYEGTPPGPEPTNELPGLAMNLGEGLFDLWASKSGPSPFTSLPKTGGLT